MLASLLTAEITAAKVSWWAWPFQQSSQLVVAGTGFWLGALSFPITILGFWIAIWQIRRATTAAQSATAAVDQLKARLAKHDAAQDLSEAEYALSVVSDHVANEAWLKVAERLEDVRRATLRLQIYVQHNQCENTSVDLQQMVAKIGKFCKAIDLADSGTSPFPTKANAKEAIRKHEDVLAKAKAFLLKEVN